MPRRRVHGWKNNLGLDGEHNDRHRYSFDGVKGPAEVFHHGTPGEAMRDAIDLIKTTHERMIERWRR